MPQAYRMISTTGLTHYYPEYIYRWLMVTHRRLIREEKQCGIIYKDPIIIRDMKQRLWVIQPSATTQLKPILDMVNFRPRRGVRAVAYDSMGGRPKHCGFKGMHDLLECGIDNLIFKQQMENDRDALQSNSNFVDCARAYQGAEVDQMIRQMKSQRKY